MSVGEVLAAAAPILASIGVGIRWLLTWYLGRREAHDNSMMNRFEQIKKDFLDESRALREQCNRERLADEEALERHRSQHLEDTKKYAESMASVTAFLRTLPASQRPPSSTG